MRTDLFPLLENWQNTYPPRAAICWQTLGLSPLHSLSRVHSKLEFLVGFLKSSCLGWVKDSGQVDRGFRRVLPLSDTVKQPEGWSPTARLVGGPLGMTSSHKGLRSYKEKDVPLKKGDVEERHRLFVVALARLDEETGTADCRMARTGKTRKEGREAPGGNELSEEEGGPRRRGEWKETSSERKAGGF